ncbi:hypothetical protein WD277_11805 [Pseudomonas fragi]|uniref:hypothetical protein n=1 Tax=Pseudomonas fragi TaxID=296 RepID=UPI0030966DB0
MTSINESQFFVLAKSLKKEFEAVGAYSLVAGKRYRSLLELRLRKANLKNEHTQIADALVVMMNPGGSEPLCGWGKAPKTLTPAKPDITQYQIMRLMKVFQWKLVRVINLSDLVDKKSASFRKKLGGLSPEHSIFSASRKSQLQHNIENANIVLCAWGCHVGLRQLSKSAINSLPLKLYGLKGATDFSYKHPLPRLAQARREWLTDTIAMLKTVAPAHPKRNGRLYES